MVLTYCQSVSMAKDSFVFASRPCRRMSVNKNEPCPKKGVQTSKGWEDGNGA